jgi:hypothetical protein
MFFFVRGFRTKKNKTDNPGDASQPTPSGSRRSARAIPKDWERHTPAVTAWTARAKQSS